MSDDLRTEQAADPPANAGASSGGPHAEYTRRRDTRAADSAKLAGQERRLSNARLVAFGAMAAMAWAIFGPELLALPWLVIPVASFVLLLLVHDRVIRAHEIADRAVTFYERGLARLEHRFAGTGTPGSDFAASGHAYARDLDVVGEGSLFELLCTARTRAGEATLAGWLLAPAPPALALERQAAVEELRERLDLREEVALLGSDVRAQLQAERLRAWGGASPVPVSMAHRIVAPLLASLSLVGLALWMTTGAGPIPFALALVLQGAYALTLRHHIGEILRSVDAPARDLDLVARLLERIEREPVSCPLLQRLKTDLETRGQPPSRRIARLHRLVELSDARRNQLFAPLAAILMWGVQFGLAIEAWRRASGQKLGRWIDAVGEFEALCSLAGFAFEHPDAVFPTFADEPGLFEAEGLGHPLIRPDACVRNDLALGSGSANGQLRALVVSGSNMSGKSTLLRSVGVAALMAQAGGPVCARALRLSPLAVGASIQVQDSLQEGASHFYAEITRVKTVMELTEGELPALFLLDEIFHGTNSHDRGIGAEAVLGALIERGAIGLVTTHDLALARVAEGLAPKADNVHFEDHLEDGRIAFDYRMRPGVVRKSNAIELMRSVGLPV